METYKFKTTEEKVEQGKKMVRNNWGKFYTDWSFSVSWVEWNLKFLDWILTINITDKPWLASWNMIKDKLNDYFN